MIIKADVQENQSLVNERFTSFVRQRFLEIFKDLTGKHPASDFVLTVNNTGGKMILNLEMGKNRARLSLMPITSEGEFRNRISEDEFFNKAKGAGPSHEFKTAMDQLMTELPAIFKKAQDK